MELIKSISGIRRIVGKTLNKTEVNSYSNIFSSIQPVGDILLARDTRPHGKKLYESIKEKGDSKIKISIVERQKNYLFELKEKRKFDYETLKYLNKEPYIKKISI